MKESEFTRVVTKVFKSMNAVVFSNTPGTPTIGLGYRGGALPLTTPGWPDRYVAHAFWSGWVEFKGTTTPSADRQRIIRRSLWARGVGGVIIRALHESDPREVENMVVRIEDWEETEMGFCAVREILAKLRELTKVSVENKKSVLIKYGNKLKGSNDDDDRIKAG